MIFCSSFFFSSDTSAELTCPSLLWLGLSSVSLLVKDNWLEAGLQVLEVRVPEMVGTAERWRSQTLGWGGGGGRTGALGGGGFGLELLLFLLQLLALLSMSSTADPLGPSGGPKGVLKFHCCSLRLRRMMRRAGAILLDFVLRKYMAVEINTVIVTITLMTPATTPRAFNGLSLLCIKKAAMGPMRGFCKKSTKSTL